jgi:hypothetical protein
VLTTITPKKQPGYSVLTKYSLFSSEMKHCLNLGEDEDRRGDKDRHHHDPDPPFGDPTAGDGFSRSTANGIKYRVMPEAASRQIWMLPTQPNPTERPGTYGTPHPHCPRSPSTKQPPSSLPPVAHAVGFASRRPFLPPGFVAAAAGEFSIRRGGIAMGGRAVAAAAL